MGVCSFPDCLCLWVRVSWLCPVNPSSGVYWSILRSELGHVVVTGSVGVESRRVKRAEIIFKVRASPVRVVLSSWA